MLSIGRARAGIVGAITQASTTEVSQWPIVRRAVDYWHREDDLQSRRRTRRILILALFFIWTIKLLPFPSHGPTLKAPSTPTTTPPEPTGVSPTITDIPIFDFNTTTQLPHIPPKIWQLYLDFNEDSIMGHGYMIQTWLAKSPSYAYAILDKVGAYSMLQKLSQHPPFGDLLTTYSAMTRRVIRADFLRYVLLAIEGGIYSDIDTQLIRPINEWVPDEYKEKTRLVIGIEADTSPPIDGTSFEVQFCQWTIASSPGHPAMWAMVENILGDIKSKEQDYPESGFSNNDVLEITGPTAWTRMLYAYLSDVAGREITWKDFTGMKTPKLLGDVLVLPINGFASNVPHSGSVKGAIDVMVLHSFDGAWKTTGN